MGVVQLAEKLEEPAPRSCILDNNTQNMDRCYLRILSIANLRIKYTKPE